MFFTFFVYVTNFTANNPNSELLDIFFRNQAEILITLLKIDSTLYFNILDIVCVLFFIRILSCQKMFILNKLVKK